MSKSYLKLESTLTVQGAVYEKLYSAIVSGHFQPGQRLMEQDLALEMGVSRTPVREALRQLERQNLVRFIPYKGVQVNQLSLAEAKEIFEIRSLLEGLVAGLAATRATGEALKELRQANLALQEAARVGDHGKLIELNHRFHSLIAQASGHQMAMQMLSNLQAHITLVRDITFTIIERRAQTVPEHERIILALEARDPKKAEDAVRQHIDAIWGVAARMLDEEGESCPTGS